jgi:uncharacterized damage-inducible protein DinB
VVGLETLLVPRSPFLDSFLFADKPSPIPFFTFNFPAAFYLGLLNNHSIHHRGELTTYLCPMGSNVPSIYLAIAVSAWK